MNVHKVLGLKVAMLVVAMLVALGGWQGVAYAQSTASFPHFTCYVITPKPSANAPLTLTDQFHPAPEGLNVVRRGPEFLCAPVLAKNGVALVQPTPPFDHLKCHNITPSGPPVNQTVVVTDQFGEETVTVRTVQFVCAPATKTPVP